MSQQGDSIRGDLSRGAMLPRIPVRLAPERWRTIGSGLSWLALAALVAVVLGELDRLIASVPGEDGRSHSLNVVLAPIALSLTGTWRQWAGGSFYEDVGTWIVVSAALDLVMVFALIMLAQRLIRLGLRGSQRWPRVALVAFVLAELVEDCLMMAGGSMVRQGEADVAEALGRIIAGATTAKWLAIIVFLVAVVRIGPYRTAIGGRLARIGQALWVHRLATLAILVLVVLSCIPAADLLDQLPDVQRQWADGAGGAWHFVWAVAALGLTAIVTFVLGRRRTRLLVEKRAWGLSRGRARTPLEAAAPWWLAPGALLAMFAIALGMGAEVGTDIHLWTFVPLFVLMLAVPVSAIIWYGWTQRKPDRELPIDRPRARTTWIVGDALAVLVLVTGAIGMVRSYVVPFTLGDATGVSNAEDWAHGLVPIGALAAVLLPWTFFQWVAPRGWRRADLDPNERADEPETAPRGGGAGRRRAADPEDDRSEVTKSTAVEWTALCAAALFLVLAMFGPVALATGVGGVAVTLLAISAWVTVFGSFTLIVQSQELIAPFRLLRLKAAPVLTLGILLPFALNIVVSSVQPDTELHAVQISNPGARAVGDDSLDGRLDELLGDTDCVVSIDGVPVRPVYLIAAEGGGIRAAYWTASALGALPGCAAKSGFVSSGISGGSVGLAVASTIDDAGAAATLSAEQRAEELVRRVKSTAGPDVVSTIMLGLAVGDSFAAGTGLHVPSFIAAADGADDTGWRWRDRAALAEALWEKAAPGLAAPFSNEFDPLTGMLMLSSTDVVAKCRLLVDQAPVEAPTAASDGATPTASDAPTAPPGATSTPSPTPTPTPTSDEGGPCDRIGGLPSMLGFRELPAAGDAKEAASCLASLDWSTATMLSARFAIVTPTGSLPASEPCRHDGRAQFVDGGYVEPTSLAAIADIAPRLMALIASKNAEHADQADGRPWLLPVLLYLRNTQGYDLADEISRAEAEPLVPITGGAAKSNLTGEDAWIQRITLALPAACPDDRAAKQCRDALGALMSDELRGGVVVVAPDSTPAVVPPLGWALSEMSQVRFTTALAAVAGCKDPNVDAAGAAGTTAPASASPSDVALPDSNRPPRYSGLQDLARLLDLQSELCAQVAAQELARTEATDAGDSGR